MFILNIISPWGNKELAKSRNKQHQMKPQVKQLTKICWHLFAPPTTSDFSCTVGVNLASGLFSY